MLICCLRRVSVVIEWLCSYRNTYLDTHTYTYVFIYVNHSGGIRIHIFLYAKLYEDNKSTWVRIHCPIDKLYIYTDITLTPPLVIKSRAHGPPQEEKGFEPNKWGRGWVNNWIYAYMYMCIHMYVCMYMYMYIYMYFCMNITILWPQKPYEDNRSTWVLWVTSNPPGWLAPESYVYIYIYATPPPKGPPFYE